MNGDVGAYSFLPWLRHGMANEVTAADFDGGGGERATIPVTLRVTGDGLDGEVHRDIPRDVALYGPGDVVGIDPRAIVRTEPRNWITNFEPNYLPFVEFYDEDFPWRYTPTAPHGPRQRLRPWLALVVLVEGDEFEDAGTLPGKPLPCITVEDLTLFPDADDLWAWAHVHVDRSLSGAAGEIGSDDMDAVLPRLSAVLAESPDLAEARLVCPRHLEENRAYHAFLVPTFETGRLAGLGLAPGGAPAATTSSWEGYAGRPEAAIFPYYHRWYFRTGTIGDFEYLVRLLQPRPVDPKVGTRDMDVQHPGSDLPGIVDPQLGGVLRLGGALKVPDVNLDEQERGRRREGLRRVRPLRRRRLPRRRDPGRDQPLRLRLRRVRPGHPARPARHGRPVRLRRDHLRHARAGRGASRRRQARPGPPCRRGRAGERGAARRAERLDRA